MLPRSCIHALLGLLLCTFGSGAVAQLDRPACGTLRLARHRVLPGGPPSGSRIHPAARPAGPGGAHQGFGARQELPEISVGTQLEFARPFGAVGFTQTFRATCRLVGENLFVFVEDEHWDTNGGAVLQHHVDALGEVFDRSSPADPERGVYELCVAAFGEPPDVDGYQRIFLLITDLPGNTVGAFDPVVAAHDVPELRRDVLFADQRFVVRDPILAQGTLAHELQHLIHWRWDRDELFWVNEGLSGYAEELTGFAETVQPLVPAFLSRPETSLTAPDSTWLFRIARDDSAPLYGGTYLFMSFLAERYGPELIRALVADPRHGRDGVDGAFARLGLDADFARAWSEWVVGNYAGGDGSYGYSALQGRRVSAHRVEQLPADLVGDVQGQYGTEVVLFHTPGNLAVDFDGDDLSVFRAWAYSMRHGRGELEEMRLDDQNRGHLEEADIDSLALIVGRTGPQGTSSDDYRISASSFAATAVVARAQGPDRPRLGSVYPNPFNGAVRVPFVLSRAGRVELAVYDLSGQRVRALVDGLRTAGRYEAVWDGRDGQGRAVASGAYLARLRVAGETAVARLTLVR